MNRPHVPPIAPGEGCDKFAQAAMLRVDRELGPAEAATLDAHLAVCPACRLKAAQAEALSTVLKGWDADGGGQAQAPARLRLKIRTAAVEQGRWRRRELRLVRRVRLATAASILLALGAGLFLGLLSAGGADAGSYAPTPILVARHDGPPPAFAPLTVPVLADVDATPSRLQDVTFDDGRVAWLAPAERARAIRHLQRSEVMTLQREAFEAKHDNVAVWVRDPGTGDLRLTSWTQLRYPEHESSRTRPRTAPTAPPGGESTTVADQTPVRDTGQRLGRFLRLPGRRAKMDSYLKNSPRFAPKVKTPWSQVFTFLRRPKDGAKGRGQVLDLVRASQAGTLVLRETHDYDLVAITKGLKWPVFVPAGELIAGGDVDRVVTEGVWIEAGEEQVPTPIRCAPIGTSGASHGAAPVATGLMGGPKLRSFLATKPHPDSVRAWVGQHVPNQDQYGRDFSLLSYYNPSNVSATVREFVGHLLRTDARGFVVTDTHGNLVSIETTELPSGSAAPVLARLLSGYLIERGIERQRRQSRREPDAPPVRTGAREASLALLDLMGAEETFRHRKMGGTGIRVLRMKEDRSGVIADVVERLPNGKVILTSVFAP